MYRGFGRRGRLTRSSIIVLALIIILLEWVTRILADAVHSLITALGLARFETWLRALPLWCVGPLTLTVVAGYAGLELGQFALLARRQYILAGLAHILKWLIFPILSYIWRLYGDRLLRYRWVRLIHGLYVFAHELILGWVHRQEWYGKAQQLKTRFVQSATRYLRNGRGLFRGWRLNPSFRNSTFRTAQRLTSKFRARRNQ